MVLHCDRCNGPVAKDKVTSLFGSDLCPNCLDAVKKFATTPINRSTSSKILHGLAVVGKKVAEGSSSSGSGMKILDDKPDPKAKKWIE